MYLNYEEMLIIAATKDDLFESNADFVTTESPDEINLDFLQTGYQTTTPLYSDTSKPNLDSSVVGNELTTVPPTQKPEETYLTTEYSQTPKAKVVKISNSRAVPFSVPKPNRGGLMTASLTAVYTSLLVSLFA